MEFLQICANFISTFSYLSIYLVISELPILEIIIYN